MCLQRTPEKKMKKFSSLSAKLAVAYLSDRGIPVCTYVCVWGGGGGGYSLVLGI